MKPVSLLIFYFIFSMPVKGIIVAGANGGADSTNNTTQQQLEMLPGVSDGHFFQNVFRMGAGNGVFLGFRNTESGAVGYALSGMHLGNISSVTIQSLTYTATRTAIDGSDLALYRLTRNDNVMPSLQTIQLANAPINNNTPVIMIGEGRNRVQNSTLDANTPDSISLSSGGEGYTTTSTRLMRWGTNDSSDFPRITGPGGVPASSVRTFDIGGRDTVVFRTVFDQPTSGDWLTTNQAQAVTNDSGGGVFGLDGSLLGIMVAVQAPSANEAQFGNTTLIADIATYRNAIEAEIGGVLIPEPGTLILLGLTGLAAVLGFWGRGRQAERL